MALEIDSIAALQYALPKLESGFSSLPAWQDQAVDKEAMEQVLARTATRLQRNYPYFHPLYAGQMLKPPHPVARAAYALATWINPNNHALDGGLASSQMELEAVSQLAAMFGWTIHLGHLTSGGTVANLEALWVGRQLAPGKIVLASEQAHYTHRRMCGVMQIPFESVEVDSQGRMSLEALNRRLDRSDVGTVVVTLGTTAVGALDPLPQIQALRDQYGFRIHVDAAYGGYFTLASNLSPVAQSAYAVLHEVDSIVIDPHKHGLQPYGCGCVLFRDPSVGSLYKHDSPYTYFTSADLHLGEISLECSRAGAAAVALWTTQQFLPLIRGGEFAAMLTSCRAAAVELYRQLAASPVFVTPIEPELDIVVWAIHGSTVEESSERARSVFAVAAQKNLHLALVQLPVHFFPPETWSASHTVSPTSVKVRRADTTVTCLRSVLMKPEHFTWIDAIWQRLHAATLEVVAQG